jgi:hypothetical protein
MPRGNTQKTRCTDEVMKTLKDKWTISPYLGHMFVAADEVLNKTRKSVKRLTHIFQGETPSTLLDVAPLQPPSSSRFAPLKRSRHALTAPDKPRPRKPPLRNPLDLAAPFSCFFRAKRPHRGEQTRLYRTSWPNSSNSNHAL